MEESNALHEKLQADFVSARQDMERRSGERSLQAKRQQVRGNTVDLGLHHLRPKTFSQIKTSSLPRERSTRMTVLPAASSKFSSCAIFSEVIILYRQKALIFFAPVVATIELSRDLEHYTHVHHRHTRSSYRLIIIKAT